jgi:2-haloacid dehalogenase
MPLDAVIFNIGGVLVEWDPRQLYRKVISDDQAVESFLSDVCSPEWSQQMDRGRPMADAIDELSELFPGQSSLISAWGSRWKEMLKGPIDGSVRVLSELRRRGETRLFGVTSFALTDLPTARERYPFLSWLEDVLVTTEPGACRDGDMFWTVTERFGVDPSATLYVDDKEACVEAALERGFHAMRFSNPAALRAALAKRGMLPERDASPVGS